MKLLIVESPNKCKKIQAILDKLYGAQSWSVAASVGHIRDLPKKNLGVDRAKDYRPTYEVSADKSSVVASLKRSVERVGKDNVYLATDPDREGESIAFHLAVTLGLSIPTVNRVMFNEITEKAVKTAITGATTINTKLVAAQEARRVIDRLAGYEVSNCLSRKLGESLAAGRVQSVALRMCVERERVIDAFKDTSVFRLKGHFLTPRQEILTAAYHKGFDNEAGVSAFLSTLSGKTFSVADVAVKPVERSPKPAFTTSTLQMDAIRKFGKGSGKWSAKKVMDLAQALFEQGAITYMRTDSPNLSEDAVGEIKQLVTGQFGATYFKARTFAAKEAAQEAHEAIRPTHFEEKVAGESDEEQKLYALIYARAVASQMASAIFEKTTISITSQQGDDLFVANAQVKKFDGYLAVYTEEPDEEAQGEEEESSIKAIAKGEKLTLQSLKAKQTYASPPKRFDEASLVAEMEKKGIGRPSTYAAILSGISRRQYVTTQTIAARKAKCAVLVWSAGSVTKTSEEQAIGGDKNKLQPSTTGTQVEHFLAEYFASLIDYTFTADMERKLDKIAEGKTSYAKVVSSFDVEHSKMLSNAEAQREDAPRKNAAILVGELQGEPMKAGRSKKDGSTYILYKEEFFSVAGLSPEEVTVAITIQAIADKKSKTEAREKATLRVVIEKGVNYSIRSGEFGIYVTNGKLSAPLKNATEETVQQYTAEQLRIRINEHQAYKKSQTSQGGKTSSKKGKK